MKMPPSSAPLALRGHIVGMSISESDDLLNLGYGAEHLREALLTICRPLLRAGADLAYGGTIRPKSDAADPSTSFTTELIELIAGEQRDANSPTSPGAPGAPAIGVLYNLQPWPHYGTITPEVEALWIDACRFIRIQQRDAGFKDDEKEGLKEILPSPPEGAMSLRFAFNRAVVLSALRRRIVEGMPLPNRGRSDWPRISATVLLGGKTRSFTGVLPGIFEEALVALDAKVPVFVLGGFGGASQHLAAYLEKGESPAFDLAALRQPASGKDPLSAVLPLVEEGFRQFRVPEGALSPAVSLAALRKALDAARCNGFRGLHNGLTPVENRTLFQIQDPAEAARLIFAGLEKVLPRRNR